MSRRKKRLKTKQWRKVMSEPITEVHVSLDLVGGLAKLEAKDIPTGCVQKYVPPEGGITVGHVFHSVMATIDPDWPWILRKGSIEDPKNLVCPDCGGMIYKNPNTGIEIWQRVAAQMRDEMRVSFALGVKFMTAGDHCLERQKQLADMDSSTDLDKACKTAQEADEQQEVADKRPRKIRRKIVTNLPNGCEMVRFVDIDSPDKLSLEEQETFRLSGLGWDEYMEWMNLE
jgi:hypothetical protein